MKDDVTDDGVIGHDILVVQHHNDKFPNLVYFVVVLIIKTKMETMKANNNFWRLIFNIYIIIPVNTLKC